MENIKLNSKELELFFEKFSYSELVKLNSFFQFAIDYNDNDIKRALENEANKKFHKKDSFSGSYRINQLNTRELEFLYTMIDDADLCLSNMDDDYADVRVSNYNLLLLIEEEIQNRINYTDMSKEELYNFYNKYSLVEIEVIRELFNTIYDYELTDSLDILEKVRLEKYDKYKKDFEVPVKSFAYKTSDLANKNSTLNKKELNYLYRIVEKHFDGILSERDIQMEDYIEDISLLMNKINEDLNSKTKIR